MGGALINPIDNESHRHFLHEKARAIALATLVTRKLD